MSVNTNAAVAQPAREAHSGYLNKDLAEIPELAFPDGGQRGESPAPMRLSDLSVSPPTVVSASSTGTSTAGSAFLSTVSRYFPHLLDGASGTATEAGAGETPGPVAMVDVAPVHPTPLLTSVFAEPRTLPPVSRPVSVPASMPDYSDLMAGLDQPMGQQGADSGNEESGSVQESHSSRLADLSV
jgi:hypothetical protein